MQLMKPDILYTFVLAILLNAATQPAAAQLDTAVAEGPITELEAFIVRESTAYAAGGIEPQSRTVSGLFNTDKTIIEIPRSVTLLTPEHMDLLQIDDLRSLSKFGAGTQLINHYGVTGTPILRGAKGATLLNGMVRSFNLNEMPLSFGSSEALDIVKGPTPPNISPTHVGGFVNLVPKQPFFDKHRGSIEFTLGSHQQYRTLLDYGGPVMLGNRPSAFRVSLTFNREGSYYDRLRNDFESAYASIKTDLTPGITAFAGFEYFHYQSSENAGWNRVTQDLIDNGNYIIGEPVNMVDASFQNTAHRDLSSYPYGFGFYNGIEDFNALVVPTAVVDAAVASGSISAAARDAMLNLADPDDRARAYGQPLPSTGQVDPRFAARADLNELLARLSQNPNEGYRYTREYFARGGTVFTTPLSGNQVLSDERDHSEATNWVGFLDLDWTGGRGTHWQYKALLDTLKTEKLSSYGYAIDTEQFILDQLVQGLDYLDWFERSTLSYGVGLRYTDAEMVQDYFAEPFPRRDISRRNVSDNSRILAGPQIGPDGLNYWSPDIGANVRSELLQASAFAQLDSQLTERIELMLSLRGEQAWYDASLPKRVQRADGTIREGVENSGETSLYSLAGNLTYRVSHGLRLYIALQDGTSLDLTQGGGIFGEDNFASARLLEGGVKFSLMEDRIQGYVSVWEWEQSRFNERDFQSEPLEGKGIEFEATLTLLRDRLFLIASAENQRLRRRSGLGFRSLPMDAEGWALNAGVFNSGVDAFPENNPELNYPGIPETTYKAHLIWKHDALKLALSGVFSRASWLNFEQTLRLPSSLLVSATAHYQWQKWQIGVGVENLTNERYFLGADPLFASNTLVTKGEPRRYSLQLKRSF